MMENRIPSGLFCVALFLAGALPGATESKPGPVSIPPAEEILRLSHKEHPRLLASRQDFLRLRDESISDSVLKRWHQQLREQSEKILAEPPSRYEIPDGLRLLATSRRVLNRTYVLAMMHRLDGNEACLRRLWQELEAAAGFPDWNPRHFLDTAEMTHAFAIAYDWLYEFWTPAQCATLRAALVEKGLKPALECYRGTAKKASWPKARHNWNQVCNGGIGLGALALADVEPELAGEILSSALRSIQIAMAEFGPDGAWSEGPAYWNYATTYNAAFLAALETALGRDFNLSQIPGFSETGLFPIYITGPLGRTFNYADGSDRAILGPHLFWMARKFHRPAYAAYQQEIAAPHPLDLLWRTPRPVEPVPAALPLDKHFRGADVISFRSAWEDREALFVGFKAGDNKVNHSHLDLGTFVLDALGIRWAVDAGADNYNLPGYFGAQRWNYYRLRAEGQNTLVINPGPDPDQDPKAAGRVLRFESRPERALVVADLSPAYARHAQKVWRGIALLNRDRVLLQDEIKTEKPAEVWWFMHTQAAVEVSEDGRAATLSHGKGRLWVRLVSPSRAGFTVMEARPLPSSPHPEQQNQNAGLRKLVVHLSGVKDVSLTISFVPLREGQAAPTSLPGLAALEDW